MPSKLSALESNIQMNWLLDFYGALLTEKQREILSLYYQEDYSLAEIAAQHGVSRQSVHDILSRAGKHLLHYEAQLNLVERTLHATEQLNAAIRHLQSGAYGQAQAEIRIAIQQFEGE